MAIARNARASSSAHQDSSRKSPLAQQHRSPPSLSVNTTKPNGAGRTGRAASNSTQTNQAKAYSFDADEIFAKHSISEVKSLLYKVRNDADAKQEELRLMVGERYRDLLQASTSIIQISERSNNVHSTLSKMEETISMQNLLSPNKAPEGSTDDAFLRILQSLAAHMKILIDASEHLWRFLERRQYLQAAWLFLLCRVVYRSLFHADNDAAVKWSQHGIDVKEQFPVISRQWDSLSQFRAQVSHKATLSLRENARSLEEVCGSLLALHFLDSLPLMDGLDLLLKQRSRGLLSTGAPDNQSPSVHRESNGGAIAFIKPELEVWASLESLLNAISRTIGVARRIFCGRPGNNSPLVSSVLQFTQLGMPSDPALSLELQPSTSLLLSSLPGGNHFSSLPQDIKSYKPYIDLSSASSSVDQPTVNTRLREWLAKSCAYAKESAESSMKQLHSVKDVWFVRKSTLKWLSSNTSLEHSDATFVGGILDGVYRYRVEEIFCNLTNAMALVFSQKMEKCISALIGGDAKSALDSSPTQFLLSAPPLPVLAHAGGSRTGAALQRFRDAISRRASGITPFLEELYLDIEKATESLRGDLECVMSDDDFYRVLKPAYIAGVESALQTIISRAEELLSQQKDQENASSDVLIGRMAYKIATGSLPERLMCGEIFCQNFTTRSSAIQKQALSHWSTKVATKAAQEVTNKVPSSESGVTMTPRLSPVLASALLSLVNSVHCWGFFNDDERRSEVAQQLLAEFISEVCKSLETTDNSSQITLSTYDVHFLRHVCDSWKGYLSQTDARLQKVLEHLQEVNSTSHAISKEDILKTLPATTQQMGLLLAAILPSNVLRLSSIKSPKSPTFDKTHRKAQSRDSPIDLESNNPIMALAKPSTRFGSLWVSDQ